MTGTAHIGSRGRERRFKLLVVGVGGQGVLSAARFIGEAALAAGKEVMVGQLHGMSQRGGSVEATVLVGPGRSSFVGPGEADTVLGLEPLETLRAIGRMSQQTSVVMSTSVIVPPNLTQGGAMYPPVDSMVEQLEGLVADVVWVDGAALVAPLGAPRTLNVAMLGVLSGASSRGAQPGLPLTADELWAAIARRSPAHFLESNRRAFALGREAVST